VSADSHSFKIVEEISNVAVIEGVSRVSVCAGISSDKLRAGAGGTDDYAATRGKK
jgi:hypothetical protein